MDIAPLYELKTRLRAAAIAGTNLISEDFRLEKAAEEFKALESASPIFKKISELTTSLLSEDCPDRPAVLLDTIILADSVICTLGVTEVKGELADIGDPDDNSGKQSAIITNVPYSALSGILNALSTTGGGQYNTYVEIRDNSPELFNDYRVKPLLVRGLGASYSELAAEVGKTILKMGKGMLPLLKKGFDPKGKRDMLRRANLIEKIGGADENAFYLKQLENAEKDIRELLIYALRHDESNFDKLVELSNTEKGKMKNAALSALLKFDRADVAEFFEKMAKKKPVDVLELISEASSEWSSDLAARLIDELLVDDNGNKVTLSEAQDFKKVTLKGNAKFGMMTAALSGKFGERIEKIYREYDCRGKANLLDAKLGESIIITNNESLKNLAIELNNEPKRKGCYIYSEAIARMLNGDECSEWFDRQIHNIYKKDPAHTTLIYTPIIKAVNRIHFENGRHTVCMQEFDEILNKWVDANPRPIKKSVVNSITDALIKYPASQFDTIISNWADPSDREYCQKLADVFIDHATGNKINLSVSLTFLRNLNVKNVKGVALKYCKNHPKDSKGDLRIFFNNLWGDMDYKLEEAREIVELLKSGELKMELTADDIREFEDWAKNRFN